MKTETSNKLTKIAAMCPSQLCLTEEAKVQLIFLVTTQW